MVLTIPINIIQQKKKKPINIISSFYSFNSTIGDKYCEIFSFESLRKQNLWVCIAITRKSIGA